MRQELECIFPDETLVVCLLDVKIKTVNCWWEVLVLGLFTTEQTVWAHSSNHCGIFVIVHYLADHCAAGTLCLPCCLHRSTKLSHGKWCRPNAFQTFNFSHWEESTRAATSFHSMLDQGTAHKCCTDQWSVQYHVYKGMHLALFFFFAYIVEARGRASISTLNLSGCNKTKQAE